MKRYIFLGIVILLIIGSCTRQVSKPESKIPIGTWKMVQSQWEVNGEVGVWNAKDTSWNGQQIKMWSEKHWHFFYIWQQDTQLSVSYGGGTYTLEGNKYFETIDYHSQKSIESHKNVLMTLEFINDTLTQTYHPFDENGLQIDSIINKERYVRLN